MIWTFPSRVPFRLALPPFSCHLPSNSTAFLKLVDSPQIGGSPPAATHFSFVLLIVRAVRVDVDSNLFPDPDGLFISHGYFFVPRFVWSRHCSTAWTAELNIDSGCAQLFIGPVLQFAPFPVARLVEFLIDPLSHFFYSFQGRMRGGRLGSRFPEAGASLFLFLPPKYVFVVLLSDSIGGVPY